MSAIVDFYNDDRSQPNPSGNSLFDILKNWSDNEWEGHHDFIQWVFPLKTPSMYNADAPILTDEDIAIIKNDPYLLQSVRDSYIRFLRFLGFQYIDNCVVPMVAEQNGFGQEFFTKAEIAKKQKHWESFNHNWLRITRCLMSLRLLGLDVEAEAFFATLSKMFETNKAISVETYKYWMNAATNPLN